MVRVQERLEKGPDKQDIRRGINPMQFVIPGLTRNPVSFWIPAFARMTNHVMINETLYNI